MGSYYVPIPNLIILGVKLGVYPRIVFKYRDLSNYTNQIFADSKFWFAQAKSFNDPFDSDLSEAMPKDAKDYEVYLKSLNMKSSEIIKQVDAANKDLSALQKLAHEKRREIVNGQGVLSLSKVHDNILMWSHYASNHTGIVIAIDMLNDPDFFESPFHIDYCDSYEELNLFSNLKTTVEKNITIKSSLWKYEEEIRIIKNRYGGHSIKQDAIKGIYFGCKTPQNEINRITALCEISGFKHIKYYQGEIVHGKFELVFVQI